MKNQRYTHNSQPTRWSHGDTDRDRHVEILPVVHKPYGKI